MNIHEITHLLVDWREQIIQLPKDALQVWKTRAYQENNWFTAKSVDQALAGIVYMLQQEKLEEWTSRYEYSGGSSTIGMVMAGNIPMVGFHDLLAALASGNSVQAKLSSKDSVLLPNLVSLLNPVLADRVEFVDKLKNYDAVIATGSNNSSRYFNHYFGKVPNIIRKNRNSLAILNGSEDRETLRSLGSDIFSYYGLGCRSVSKLMVPDGYDFTPLFESIEEYKSVDENHKYSNNYGYNRSVFLVNNIVHMDTGFLLARQDTSLSSPIAVIHFDTYSSQEDLQDKVESDRQNIQCIVGTTNQFEGMVQPGKSQEPEPWDYADQVDTMKFLTDLNR